MLAILSLTLLTAITVASGTSLVTPVFAKKKHCDKSDSLLFAKNDKNLSNANNPSTQSDRITKDIYNRELCVELISFLKYTEVVLLINQD